MAKPTIDEVRFAVDGGTFADAANISAPASGLKNTGYADNAIPTAKNINYLFNKGYRWDRWVAAQLDDVTTLPQPVTRSPYTTGFVTTHASIGAGTNIKVPILGLKKGDTIVAIRARGADAGGPPVIVAPTVGSLAIVVADLTDYVLVMAESGGGQFTVAIHSVTDGVASAALATSPNVAAAAPVALYACSVDVQRPVTP